METLCFEESSELEDVSQAEVWQRITSWEGVDHELGPIFTMSHPARYPTVADVPADGTSHFTSYLRLGGVLPFDAHRVALREFVVPSHFDESSSNLLLRRWNHHRSVTPTAHGVRVRDRCSLAPRLPGSGPLLLRIYAAIFRRRHRRLRAWFAQAAATATR